MRILFGCTLLVLAVPAVAQAPLDVKKAEAIVLAMAREYVGDADSIKVAKWGPHDLECKSGLTPRDVGAFAWPPLQKPRYSPDDRIGLIRVQTREKDASGTPQLKDGLFGISKGKVVFVALNPYGDNWIARFTARKKAKAKAKG